MTKTVANRSVAAYVRSAPDYEVEGYGAVSYTPNGYATGYLPQRLVKILDNLRQGQRHIPMIYSYGTPIAWYDRGHRMWVQPRVYYSVTTSKHQSQLYSLGAVSIPGDCGIEEYERYASLKMCMAGWPGDRNPGTRPGPAFIEGE